MCHTDMYGELQNEPHQVYFILSGEVRTHKHTKWSSTRDFDTYRISEQQMLRRVCAYAQTRLSLRCSHIQSMDVVEGSS